MTSEDRPAAGIFQSACAVAAAIAAGQVTAEAVTQAHLDQIRQHHAEVNAVVTLDEAGALAQARAVDRGEVSGVLAGVPITVKDAWAVRGVRSTGGYPPLADTVPDEDAFIVAQMRTAGAVILGKTNVPILSSDTQTDNEIFGRTNNPWNTAHTPGGSSGGSAAAVASGMSALDIGSDVAGSVRIPAHYCGVYSLKTTEHRISMTGHIPPLPGSGRGIRRLSVAGPIARSIDDLALALGVLVGADPRRPEVPPVPLGAMPEKPPPSGLQIAWSDRFGHVSISEGTQRVISEAAELLARNSCMIRQAFPENFAFPRAWEVFGTLYWGQVGAAFPVEIDAEEAALAGFTVDSDDAFSRGAGRIVNGSLRTYQDASLERDGYVMALDAFLETWDVLICPVAATPAIPHMPHMSSVMVAGQRLNYFERGTYYCIPFNLTGHPVVVIPAGFDDDGLPIGLQIVGKRWGEMPLLAAASVIDGILSAYRQPPGFGG